VSARVFAVSKGNLTSTRGPGNHQRGVVARDGGDASGGSVSPGGWLAGFPGRADADLAITIGRSRPAAWAPVSGFKKIAENARKRRFQFPENRGKNGNRVKKFDEITAAAF